MLFNSLLLTLCLMGAVRAQRIGALIPGLGGRVAQDSTGHWVLAQSVSKPDLSDRNVRVRNFAEDSTAFDMALGGSGNDDLSAIVVLPGGDIVILGTTDSKDFPASPSGLWAGPGVPEYPSSFLVRLDRSGKVRASTYLAAPGISISARALAVAGDGSLIIGAELRGLGPAKFGETVIPGNGTLLVLKADAALTRVVAGARVGGMSPCTTTLASVQLDGKGGVFVAGTTCGDDFPTTPNAYLSQRPGGACLAVGLFVMPTPCTSGVIVRLDADFHVVSATYLGGTASAFLRDLAVDRDGFPYVTGMAEIFPASNGAFPTTPGAYQETLAARLSVFRPESVFVTKLTPDLSGLVYSTFLDGSRSESPSSILVDTEGRAVVAGRTVSRDFPATGAFQTPCGPDPGSNPPEFGFVSRLAADGRSLSSSATLQSGSAQLSFVDRDRLALASTGNSLVQIDLDSGDAPSVSCVVNGANFRTETVVTPNQLLTFIGAYLPDDTVVRFEGAVATVLYRSSTQINAVVPTEVARHPQTVVTLDSGGVVSNIRAFTVLDSHPTVKLLVTGDGKLVDRGNPLADVRLSDGSSNSIENAAHHGEDISILTTGVDLHAPLEVVLGADKAEVRDAFNLPSTFGSVQVLIVRVPEACCGGMRVITITNGGQRSDINPGFVWIE